MVEQHDRHPDQISIWRLNLLESYLITNQVYDYYFPTLPSFFFFHSVSVFFLFHEMIIYFFSVALFTFAYFSYFSRISLAWEIFGCSLKTITHSRRSWVHKSELNRNIYDEYMSCKSLPCVFSFFFLFFGIISGKPRSLVFLRTRSILLATLSSLLLSEFTTVLFAIKPLIFSQYLWPSWRSNMYVLSDEFNFRYV